MAVLPLRFVPDPVLRQKARRVPGVDTRLEKLVADMIETMVAAPGVGLAAPQVGVSWRVAVIGMPDEESMVLINPAVVRRTGERLVEEGCLSLPSYRGEIKRSVSVTVKARNLRGKEFRIKAEGLLAQALEHEIDHLNGVLYVDHLESPDALYRIQPEEEHGL
ncbi:MAG: peptide deformylase [Chloroflexi bacterium RBG_13_54_8]|nr:MAG: peptide deformylase [Chloroflexi bacterium RBG_13_54_8]